MALIDSPEVLAGSIEAELPVIDVIAAPEDLATVTPILDGTSLMGLPVVTPEEDYERELENRFSPEVQDSLAREFLENKFTKNWQRLVGDRQFVVALVEAEGPYGDLGRSVETLVFAEAFEQGSETPLSNVVHDYGKYDAGSVFTTVIDVSTPLITPAGELRIAKYDPRNPGFGYKDLNDLVADSSDNPWLQEIKEAYFHEGEIYDEALALQRLFANVGMDVDLTKVHDISTHAAHKQYRDKRGGIDGPSMMFFHQCQREAVVDGAQALAAIFDVKPLANVQQFNNPFDTYAGLNPHPYGGPGDTMPAICDIQRSLFRIPRSDESGLVGGVFVRGDGLGELALMPSEYEPEKYSNDALGDKLDSIYG